MRQERELSKDQNLELVSLSQQARCAILKMTTLAGSGHPGGSMSTIDLLLSTLSQTNLNSEKSLRDKIIISHGHVSPAAYSALALYGYFPLDKAVSEFRLTGSIFEGHVEPDVPGIIWATGNLGQGLSAACGFALAEKIKKSSGHVYVLMGDGEQQKGQLSEARRFAVKFGLTNITALCDFNRLQISGKCSEVMPQNIKAEYEASGWNVLEINGHKFPDIISALQKARSIEKPVLILAQTVMGKGVSFMENDEKWHGQALPYESEDGKDLIHALQELGGENDLARFKEMRKEFARSDYSPEPLQWKEFPLKTEGHISYTDKTDNRTAWGNALLDIAEQNNDKEYLPMAVFDCDLAGSVKTAKFAAKFPQNFFQSGIMEHHTAVCAGAFSKCGFQTFYSDFGVFGIDETYNQHRLNDINKTNLKIVLTHVGIDVGEDGKTHQCIDYLALTRNLFNFRCIVPADANQTDHIIRWLAAKEGNFLVAMGRSKLPVIQSDKGTPFFADKYAFSYGKADLLRNGNQAALLVMGTLTSTAVQTADLLKKSGIKIQVWNVSCPQDIATDMLKKAAATNFIFTLEDHNVNTGLASLIQAALIKEGLQTRFHAFGISNYPLSGKSSDVFRYFGLYPERLAEVIKEKLSEKI